MVTSVVKQTATIKGMKRTHYSGEVNLTHKDSTVTVMGWVNKRRYLSHLIFIVVRDRTGIVQVVVDESKNPELYKIAKDIRTEYVVAVKGKVIPRTPENINPEMATGEIEIEVDELRVLSEAELPPFQVADKDVATDMRLKYRYIDLRRPEMQKIFMLRHAAAKATRDFLSNEGFLEIETPILINSSPEGARDYLVPAREHPGSFYALPQSPQQMKQILMISGFDRYFQIARCFRDEDLRADRQPEFSQVDIEMSFVNEENIFEATENLMVYLYKTVLNEEIKTPFPRITWAEAMERFGSDKPDMRFEMEIKDVSDVVKNSDFQVFQGALDSGGSVRGINAKNCSDMPRKQIDAFVELAKNYKAKGLAWIVCLPDGTFKTTLSKFFSDDKIKEIINMFNAEPGDLIFLCADNTNIVLESLGHVRLAAAKWKGIIHKTNNFLWVTEFPLFEWSEEDKRFYSAHHPFTSPMEEDEDSLETDTKNVRARAYDLVLNGVELGGGSIRIHRPDLQDKIFKTLGFTKESAEEGFGYFLEALKYGTPPHGGIAFGFDRIIMMMVEADSLREVIAFPKVKDASCPMTGAPNDVAASQLEELEITFTKKE